MKIIVTDSFRKKLSQQVRYIAQESPSRARKFNDNILWSIKGIVPNPYKHRKSIYFDDLDIRDLVYRGYTIVFRINTEDQQIEVFGLVKFQEKPTGG